VVEYGPNWTLIADTLSTTSSIQGVNRRAEWCKARYAVLQKTPMEVGARLAERAPLTELSLVTARQRVAIWSQALTADSCTVPPTTHTPPASAPGA
jgi:hypothetical protein